MEEREYEWKPDPIGELLILSLQCEMIRNHSDEDEREFWQDAAQAAHDVALQLAEGYKETV